MTYYFSVIEILAVIESCRTVAEELFRGFELLMDLETRLKSYPVVIGLCRLTAGQVANCLFTILIVPARTEIMMRKGSLSHRLTN